jgi:hypothetical protein
VPLFIRIGSTTYNAATLLSFAFSSEKTKAVIRFEKPGNLKAGADREPVARESVSVPVDDAIITRLLDQLTERNMLIELDPGSPATHPSSSHQPK